MSGPVLLVHDDIGTIAAVRRVLTRAGHEVVLATSAADALIAFGHHLPSMIVLGPAVESGRGKVILEELALHPSGAEARVLLLGEEVDGYVYPVVPLPLDGASFLELFESALSAPAYTQPGPLPAAPPSLEDTLFGDLPAEERSANDGALPSEAQASGGEDYRGEASASGDGQFSSEEQVSSEGEFSSEEQVSNDGELQAAEQSSEERAHAAVELAMEQAHQEFEAEAAADLDASLARAGSEQDDWDPFASGSDEAEVAEPPLAEDDEELLRLEAEVREEAARRRQARLAQAAEVEAAPDAQPLDVHEHEAPGVDAFSDLDGDAEQPQSEQASADSELDFGEVASEAHAPAALGDASLDAAEAAPAPAPASDDEQLRLARRAALLQAQREAKEARIRLAELRAEREDDGADIQLESDDLLQKKQKEWAEREERIRHYESLRQERLRQAEQEAEVARELAAHVPSLVEDEPELLADDGAVQEVGAAAEPYDDWGSAEPDAENRLSVAEDPAPEIGTQEGSGSVELEAAAFPSEVESELAAEQGADLAAEHGSDSAAEQGSDFAAEQRSDFAAEQRSDFAAEQGSDFAAQQESEYSAEEGAEYGAEQGAEYGAEQGAEYGAEQGAGYGAEQGTEYAAESPAEELAGSEMERGAEHESAQELATGSQLSEGNEGDLLLTDAFADAEGVGTDPSSGYPPDLDSAAGPDISEEIVSVSESELAGQDRATQEAAHRKVALEISEAIADEVGDTQAAELADNSDPDVWSDPEDSLQEPDAETGGWSLQQDLATAAPIALEPETDTEPEPDSTPEPAAASDELLDQHHSAQALATAQAQAVELEVSAAASAELELQQLSVRSQVSSAAAARALAMAREAEEEAREAQRRQAEARRLEQEQEEATRRELMEQTRRAVELEAQAHREREARERLAVELAAQAQRDQQERDRLAAELQAQAERERLERQRLEQAEQERAAREQHAQTEREELAEALRQRELAEAHEREEREKEARILAENARQEREARERLEQQLLEQLQHEREERERAAQALEAAQEAARASEERVRTALQQVDEEKHGRQELERIRQQAEAEAEKARAEAREMAARAEAALVAIPKEKGVIERVARTGIAPLEKLAELIRDLTSARVDVRLELKADDALRILWLRGGGIAGALSTAPGETLLDRARQDGLIDPSQLRRLAAYKDRPASDQLASLREQGLLRESEVIPLVQRYTEAVALAAFSEAGSLYRLATEAIPADVPLAASTRPVIHLLAEGLRRGADPAAVLAAVGGLRAIPVRKRSELDPERLELSERERRLLESVDGEATLESLLLGAGFRQDAALRLFVVARALGLVELIPAPELSAGEPQPELEVQRLNAKLSEIREADYFTVLGVPRSAGKDEILRAFQLLSTEFHPLRFSTHPDPGVPRRAEELLSVLSEAVAALGDDRLRGQYARNLTD